MVTWEWLIIGLAILVVVGIWLLSRWVPNHSDEGRLNFVVWLAQGFGVGLIPAAPGTFGSLLGLGWFALLVATGYLWGLVLGSVLLVPLSVWSGGIAERVLKKKDPSSVVLDEVAAMPLCFFGWVGVALWQTGSLPPPGFFFGHAHWPLTVGIFAGFRFFDVLKPWPIRQSQVLPGGWGITIDDLLAAGYVNAVVLVVLMAGGLGAK
jgi:phosphatidylglycerophosphatase A